MTFEEAKQQAIERSEWVLSHGAGYYTARTPERATESVEVYFGMERNGLISA
jgi:hypothetical protein